MFPIQKIICPIDFSEHSYDALKIAVELAGHFFSEIILVHVITPIPSYTAAGLSDASATPQFDLAEYLTEVEVAAKQSLDKILNDSVPEVIQSRSVILHGSPAESIVDYAVQEKANMIVISTHGRTGFRHLIFGSVAEKVVRLAACPVLSIRPKQQKG
ncbi:MAG TPA: universal stress protein [Thermodesulfobacteriota bacterium]|nr:universal stress protein [Deltaproteobacteria bacterium]HNR12209.1 universal stress protein [Thermodesulfobacteriota bacterium]HNU73131.1 universal stress protein [Thermodesulfobacteriota bacterium]HQO78704.1 universal stress protein [Thermodesulfobacteriota bacterium]